MITVNRGCIVHGKNVGLDGDKTSTGATCYASRTGFSVMGRLKLYIGDKTSPCPKCGKPGVIAAGDVRQSNMGIEVAVDGSPVACGCPAGTNFLIAPATVEVNSPSWADTSVEPEQHAQTMKKQNHFAGTCKPEDNALLNGVYIWTETMGAGHAFVSVHESNHIHLYTYGRYGRTDPSSLTGDGILNYFQDEDARKYYRYELYEMDARVFRIDDANPDLTRQFFEELWHSGAQPAPSPNMEESTVRRGHTIDKYDVTGRNCTTHSVEGIKFSGSKVFRNGYKSITTQLHIESEDDFTVPISLENYLQLKSTDYSSMLVIDMTSTFHQKYPNIGNKSPHPMGGSARLQQATANASAVVGSASPYSGGAVGGSLGSTYDDE